MAVAIPELAAVVYRPRIHGLPLAPNGFPGFALWQGMVIPVLDFERRLGIGDATASGTGDFLGIVRFPLARPPQSSQPPEIGFGGLRLAHPPITVTVSDDLAAPFPPPADLWPDLSWSCFQHQGVAVPILNLSLLFGGQD